MLDFLAPWQFDPFAVLGLVLGAGAYGAGIVRGARPSIPAVVAYSLGLGLMYAVLHTRLDYYAQYLFAAHRGQHLVLHHLGPFLIALSNPVPVWRRAFGGRLIAPAWLKAVYRFLQHPVVAPVLFVGLIFFWLHPEIHFDAMLSHRLYLLMNWSMALDGLLFWYLMMAPRSHGFPAAAADSSAVARRAPSGRLDVPFSTPAPTSSPRDAPQRRLDALATESRTPWEPVPRGPGHLVDLGYGTRVIILLAVMFPQIVLGAYIALGPTDLYDVYAVCGRAFPLSPADDQLYGGLLTWIPAAMMSVLGAVIVLGRWMRDDTERRGRVPGRRQGASRQGV